MKMEQIIYSDSLLVAWAMLFVFGICLIFTSVPNITAFKNYLRSRTILGVALIIFGIQIMLQWMFDFRGNALHIATALNITCYYLEGILFGMSFISLLRPSYICRRQMVSDFGKWSVSMVVMWAASTILEGTVRIVLQIAVAAFFFFDATRIAIIFFRTYHRALKSMDDYYADNVKHFVAWLSKSTYGIVFFGLTGAVLAFAPKAVIAVQMLLGIGMFIYIFLSFLNYMLNAQVVEVATMTDDEAGSMEKLTETDSGYYLTEEQEEKLVKEIKRFTAEAGFAECGLNIDTVSAMLRTNRTYLSNYINSHYNCTFHDWIGSLRLDMAKRLLREYPTMPLGEVATRTGFSSQSNLAHRFRAVESMPPGRWRKKML